MRHLPLLLGLLMLVRACGMAPAFAHDMNHPDLDGWYESLYRLDGSWCCNRTDCLPTDYRIGHDGYEVLIDERFPGVTAKFWAKVPDKNIVPTANPTGSGVACWWGGEVRCFVPLVEG